MKIDTLMCNEWVRLYRYATCYCLFFTHGQYWMDEYLWMHVKSMPEMVQLQCFAPVSEMKTFLSIDASTANRFCQPYGMRHMHAFPLMTCFFSHYCVNKQLPTTLPFFVLQFKYLCYVVTSRCKYFSCKVFIWTFNFHKICSKINFHWMNVNKTKKKDYYWRMFLCCSGIKWKKK